ncbi:alpha/beta fold hydrolase (plasmid) [Pseudonocardia bannensis]|uniref:Alpha/beta fold hydrolase n=1 Tax=Pseudonocardia bannensis TaxID=630973 RepID=A0A848DHS9_9PSEU|nr:alpha/beta fold hydrolase [Pseudonocardia bannensis]NMH92105.1 alpha/beta fold hydrolase [Pseudonocardia bannensis]
MSVTEYSREVPSGLTVHAAGHRTNYYDNGEGPPLVLLHGSGPGVSAYSNWHSVTPLLASNFRTIAPDIAGYGLTEFRADGHYDIKLWAAHLLAVLDALEVDRAVLVGNSFGGALAIATAVFAPERVAGLVLLGTPAGEFPMTPGLRSGWYYEPSPENMRAILREFPFDPGIVTDEMVAARYALSARPGAQEAFRRLVPEPSGADGGTVRGAGAGFLAKVAAPALIVHGREDRVVPLEAGLFAGRHIPGADMHVFGRCGHWVQLERPEAFARQVALFAGGLG